MEILNIFKLLMKCKIVIIEREFKAYKSIEDNYPKYVIFHIILLVYYLHLICFIVYYYCISDVRYKKAGDSHHKRNLKKR